jgi:hypothetical protein
MSGKADNHPFRSQKTHWPHDPSKGDVAHRFPDLTERVIILCKEDIRADPPDAPLLDWSNIENGQIAIQLKDTQGLGEGNVTIRASTLQRIHPKLLPVQLDADYLFPILLRTVVSQVQQHFEQNSSERPKPVSPEFDTPISQVAREDEELFRLERLAKAQEEPVCETIQAKPNTTDPILTPADRPGSRFSRQSLTESKGSSGSSPDKGSASEVIRSERVRPLVGDAARRAVLTSVRAKTGADAQSRTRRAGLERLREIFMTEDQLDASQVADLLATFPKVKSALVMLDNGTVLGGTLPEGYHMEAALITPFIMQRVRDFSRELKTDEVSAFTLLGERPVTLFAERHIYILIVHEGRGLLPGMRERISEVAKSLDLLCCEPDDSIQPEGKEAYRRVEDWKIGKMGG